MVWEIIVPWTILGTESDGSGPHFFNFFLLDTSTDIKSSLGQDNLGKVVHFINSSGRNKLII